MVKVISLILLTASMCYSDMAYTYLVKTKFVPTGYYNTTNLFTVGKLNGSFVAMNTSYIVVSIIPNNKTELDFFKTITDKGYAVLLSTQQVITKGKMKELDIGIINKLPDDYEYKVVITTK